LNAILQVPTATLALQLWVPSLSVTVPVGVPLPGALTATVKVKVTAWPTVDGSGASLVIVVVVPAAFTVWPTLVVLPAKSASPAYDAVSVRDPAELGVSEQLPCATVPLQLSGPSLTVTLPVGAPLDEVTLKETVIACPKVEGSGEWPVIVVVVAAWLTVCPTLVEVLAA